MQAAMEKRGSSGSASLLALALLLAASLASFQPCHGARGVPAGAGPEEEPLRPQNVFGFGGFYPGPTVNWVFPGPNGITPQVGFGGMPGSGAFPGVGGGGGVSPFTPGGGGVVGIHGGGGAAAGAAAKKP
ncbi:translation initiation factor IF-2-like [Panicum virgatum]|uniref:Glycine-rich protein n=1 Tax=Panicum virgatum TaxID=38727 RepID=A0A8T0SK05_PANVG|nr:translation initiation factor IF-2-like [Panicum virgatum]KAG2597358.1 hypothetical protein PVAP13_5KG261100 [Panicum virgatum]